MSNPDPGPGFLAIGELAERSGKRPSAIRYYEEIGLLPAPARVAGRRRYDSAALRTLAVLDQCPLFDEVPPPPGAAARQTPGGR